MQTAKFNGMVIGCLQHLAGPGADTGITSFFLPFFQQNSGEIKRQTIKPT